jgi:starch-binding outer membrane protein, SusD/RagB family
MKKSFRVFAFLLFISLSFTLCKRQLDLQPLGELTDETFYQTEEDFEAATLSPYATLLTLYYDQTGAGWYQPVLFPDDDVTVASNSSDDIEDFNWLPTNGNFQMVWQTCYKGIQRANVVLAQLPEAKAFKDESKKPRYEAEAKFMRAYYHFILAVNWGMPPVSDSSIQSVDQSRLPNSQPGEIWDLITSDLTFAKQNLPAAWDANNVGRATSGAAAGLLGKALLYRAQWESKPDLYAAADAEFTAVINSNQYALTPVFSDNFNINTENNVESVYEIQFAVGRENNWFPNEDGGGSGNGRYIMWRAACEQGNCAGGANAEGYGFVHVVLPLQNEFEPGDPRRIASIFKDGDPFPSEETPVFSSTWSVTGSTPAKYIREDVEGGSIPGQPNYGTNNERVLRYADILLMSAECKLLGNDDVAGAAELINQVRKRADDSETILTPRSATSSKEQMWAYLQHERRVELCFEGNRYNDLVRWHRAGLINIGTDIDFGRSAANNNWQPKNLLKPVPQRELDLNENLAQNEGY